MKPKLNVTLLIFVSIAIGVVFSTEIFTPEEQKALKEFRPKVEGLLKHDYEKQDIYLIHWLRARNLDVADAKEMLQKAMTWRKQNDVDNILENKEALALAKKYPAMYGVAKDKHGDPALQILAATWDLRKGYLSGDDFRKFLTYMLERISTMAFKSGKSHWLFLDNMHHFSLRQHVCLACTTFYLDFVTIYENYYPNTAKVIHLLNTPRAFEAVLPIIRPLMAKHTKEAMKIFGTDKEEWRKAMLQHFDPSELTPAWGGTKDAKIKA